MDASFEIIKSLQYQLKAANTQLLAFQSGEKLVQMEADYHKKIKELEKKNQKLKSELAKAHKDIISIRNQWFEIFEELEKEMKKERKEYQKKLGAMEQRALNAEQQRDKALEKITQQRQKMYQIESALEEEKGKRLKLEALLHHNYENSSIPSSMSMKRKKITNNREKSNKKQGAQPGHKGHGRKKQIPTTEPILLPPPQEVLEDKDFKKTSKTIVKQKIGIRLVLEVTEYHADVYCNSKTGERVHASFPKGVIDDVNYDGSIKAFLFLLNNDCGVSIEKSRRFLSELTQGKLNVSRGMINKLSKEFAKKSKLMQKEIFQRMLMAPVLHTDFTNARENGKSVQVMVCATPNGEVLYFARKRKGHEGIKGTPLEDFCGILIHDHDKTFYHYGKEHQECLAHILRYLLDSIENEPDRTWNKEMRALLQEMIHYRNSLPLGEICDNAIVEDYEKRYSELLKKAKEEYESIPASNYYKDGYNLYLRMEEYRTNHLLFLHDMRVPPTNNEAERLLRIYKRKQRQAVSFRSFDSIDFLCQCMSMLVLMRKKEENIFDKVSQIFG